MNGANRKHDNPMKRLLVVGTFLIWALLPSAVAKQDVNVNVNARAKQCPSDHTVKGYTSIADINQDQEEELERITKGTIEPSPPYSFVLCPRMEFDTSLEPLKPILSGSVISCGSALTSFSSTMDCYLTGSSLQVYLEDSDTPNYDLSTVTLIGLTFAQFNGTSIEINASEKLTLTLMDVIWKDFFSDFVVRQQRTVDGSSPARVEVVSGVINNGLGGSLFSNDGGVLDIKDLTVSGVTAAGLVSTANGGVTWMRSPMVTRSTIDTIASAMTGSTLSIMEAQVYDLTFTKTIFHAEDAGTKLILNRTTVRDIDHESVWTGVFVDDYAEAVLDQVVFTGNKKFENLVHAQGSATIDVLDSLFEQNVGRSPTIVSNLLFAIYGSAISISRTKLFSNTDLTALFFATVQSTMTLEHSCVMGGSSEEVAFVSHDSMAVPFENYVAVDVVSNHCPEGGDRLSVEQFGYQCYQGEGNSCRRICGMFADQTTCVADMVLFGRQANATVANATTPPVVPVVVPNGTATTVAPTTAVDPMFTPNTTTAAPTTVLGGATTPPGVTAAPTTLGATAPPGNTTDAPIVGNETTVSPTVSETTAMPTSETGDQTTRIVVAFVVRNDMMITNPEDVLASGLGVAWPVYVAELVANLTASARRQLQQLQRRRLEVSLVPDSATIYEIFPTGCIYEDRETNMTTSNFSTCHEAMGRYDLLLTPDEDPTAIQASYTSATRSGIDDGTFQQILLRVEPSSPLLVGPSVEPNVPNETLAPTTYSNTSGPTSTLYPSCAPSGRYSKSKGSKGKGKMGMSKGGSGGSKSKGKKMMRHHPGYRRTRRNLGHSGEYHDPESVHFANALKDHDEGAYYPLTEHEEEEELYGLDEEEELEDDSDECVEPPEQVEVEETYYHGSSKGSSKGKGKGKGADYYKRNLREDLPRIHGAHHEKHRLSDFRKILAHELKTDERVAVGAGAADVVTVPQEEQEDASPLNKGTR